MDFEFSDEQQQFAQALRKWTERAYTFEHRQQIAGSTEGVNDADWSALTDLGLVGLGVPAERGGFDGTGVDHMIAMQEMGRAMLVEPLFSTLWGCAFLRLANSQHLLLERVAEGQVRLACALGESASRYDLDVVECVALACEGGWRLKGEKNVVPHGAQANVLIVSARTSGTRSCRDGISLFAVNADAPGLRRSDFAMVDGQRAARVMLQDVLVPADALIGVQGGAWPIIDAAMDAGVALLCAEAIGVLEVLTEATLEHLRTRQQFGVTIGKFQALQHRMAEVYVHLEQSRSMAMLAAIKCTDAEVVQRRRSVSAAKARIGEALRFVGQQAVQLHGGLGVSDEMRVSHLFKRATVIEMSLGDTQFHVERFMEQLACTA